MIRRNLLMGVSVVGLVVVCFALAPRVQADGPVDGSAKPMQQWQGSVEGVELNQDVAEVITDGKVLADLWTKWKLEGAVPEIDFAKQFVYVATTRGSRLSVTVRTDAGGNLMVVGMATRDLRPGFRYVISVFSRQGVKKVNGKALEAAR